jgi:amino acid transporter
MDYAQHVLSRVTGGFDCSVHISEEARNANVAIPWAIMSSTTLACILGWSMVQFFLFMIIYSHRLAVVNIVLAFTMGKDLENILGNPIGQPLATVSPK